MASAQNEQFSIQITYGANNVLMGEAWIPVTVQVKNKGGKTWLHGIMNTQNYVEQF